MKLLLDTNAYSAMMRGESAVVSRIRAAEHLYLSYPVVGELLYGFRLGRREEENLQMLRDFLAMPVVSLLETDYATCEVYARIGQRLREVGKPIPTNDHWIAALALQHNLVLISRDEHFRDVPGLEWKKF